MVSACYLMEAKAQRTRFGSDGQPRKRRGGVTIVPFSGELDVARYPIFHSAFAKVLELERPVVLDLTRVTRIDSTFLTELLLLVRRRSELDCPTVIASDQPRVLRLINLAQLRDRLQVVATVLEAARAIVAFEREEDRLEG